MEGDWRMDGGPEGLATPEAVAKFTREVLSGVVARMRSDRGDLEIDDLPRDDPRRAVTYEQLRAITRIAAGGDRDNVALALGIHPLRMKRWHSIPRFRRALMQEKERKLSSDCLRALDPNEIQGVGK
jgi:hypothetical protein